MNVRTLRPDGPETPRLLVEHARIVAAAGVIEDGWLLASDRIEAIGRGVPPRPTDAANVDAGGEWLVPGFVDVHCHGGGGRAIYSGQTEDVRIAARTHLEHGTTTMLASIGSMALPRMLQAASAVATVIEDGSAPNLVGIHFEGPFLSPQRSGAQTANALVLPSESVLDSLLDAAGGHTRLMTIAPELPGAIELVARRPDIEFAIGHTDADSAQFDRAVDAGAHHVTHLFNAMPPIGHRAPGPAVRAMLDDRVTVEIIADGHHLADDAMRLALRTAGRERVVLVTDAMAATGLGDGHYAFADREVDVTDGVARLHGTATLAGSTLLLAEAFERLVSKLGVSVPDAVRMASTNAADRMRLADRGRLETGARADLLLVSNDGSVRRLLRSVTTRRL